MTTNSFGGALPRFDFPAQPAPAVTRMARISKALPVVLAAATIAAIAPKTTQDSSSFGRSSMVHNLVQQGQVIVDKRSVDVGLKPNK
ncbi:hypothetical protein FHETE_6978 [Fusarium heterosporum]|uniref:Uncharacterized protein n=1 Tax=Fusarium heterosporum TaxID=42747 RepID=A0A8H5T7T4_FUSHE|nr:hypothetical protein FHETE_6978 [Fusarium heterosporum]